MMIREFIFFFIPVLVVATIIAAPLALIPALQPQRKHYWQRFGYAFQRWGVPLWCVFEMLFWLITKRWIPWMP
jgi:hypothetical protein